MKILVLTNYTVGLYKFRRELLEKLMKEKHKVYVSVPDDEYARELKSIGVKIIRNQYLERRGTNPIWDLKLLCYYRRLLKKIRPGIVLTYTIKPNVYGGYLCGRMKIPYIANVTGLGTSIQNGGVLQALTLFLYKIGLRKAQKVFFQNEENRRYMLAHGSVDTGRTEVLPGSGVNTEQHCYEPYPETDEKIIFTTIGRIMKDKGIDELIGAAEEIKKKHSNIVFRLIGNFEEEYCDKICKLHQRGIIEYLGFRKDIHPYIAESHAIIHASYHEGMSNVLLEAASTGRPVIATNIHGCIEAFEPGVTGIACEPGNTESLIEAIGKFLSISHEEKERMGRSGRQKIVREFDRQIVVEAYMAEIRKSQIKK